MAVPYSKQPPRLTLRRALVAALLASGCAGPAGAAAVAPPAVTEVEARSIAEKTAEAAGYARGVYVVQSTKRVDAGSFAGTWEVFFEHVPPAPPGGHCTVYVRVADGTTQLFQGK